MQVQLRRLRHKRLHSTPCHRHDKSHLQTSCRTRLRATATCRRSLPPNHAQERICQQALTRTIMRKIHRMGSLTESPIREGRAVESIPLMFMNMLECQSGSITSDLQLPMGPGASNYLYHDLLVFHQAVSSRKNGAFSMITPYACVMSRFL